MTVQKQFNFFMIPKLRETRAKLEHEYRTFLYEQCSLFFKNKKDKKLSWNEFLETSFFS